MSLLNARLKLGGEVDDRDIEYINRANTLLEEHEGKTKTGKGMETLTLDDNRKASIFEWHSMFGNYQVGNEVTEQQMEQNGQYWNIKDPNKKTGTGGGQVAKMQKRKEETIAQAQDNKNKGIMIASSFRMATDIVTAMITAKGGEEVTRDNVKTAIKHWRSWIIQEWENPTVEDAPPFGE